MATIQERLPVHTRTPPDVSLFVSAAAVNTTPLNIAATLAPDSGVGGSAVLDDSGAPCWSNCCCILYTTSPSASGTSRDGARTRHRASPGEYDRYGVSDRGGDAFAAADARGQVGPVDRDGETMHLFSCAPEAESDVEAEPESRVSIHPPPCESPSLLPPLSPRMNRTTAAHRLFPPGSHGAGDGDERGRQPVTRTSSPSFDERPAHGGRCVGSGTQRKRAREDWE